MRRLALMTAVALSLTSSVALAKAPADPCKGVTLTKNDFTGEAAWNAAWFGQKVMSLGITSPGVWTLEIPAAASELTPVVIESGFSEIVLDDGTLWKDALTGPVAGKIMSNGSGTLWTVSLPLKADRLAVLAEHKVKNIRITSGTAVFGNLFAIGMWTGGLQKASQCMLSTVSQ